MWTGLKNVSYRSGATLYAASRIRKSYSRSIRMRKDVSTAAPPVAASCALVGGGGRARHRTVLDRRAVAARGGAGLGCLYARARAHLPRLLAGAGGGGAL